MQPSAFNVRVPLETGDVFLVNTMTDAQLVASADAARLLDRVSGADGGAAVLDAESREALATFTELGFVVESREADEDALDCRFREFREDTSQLRVTILTTLECNFACEYCYQGETACGGRPAAKMSPATGARVAEWIAAQLDTVRPRRLVLTFFGGEPLLNTPVMIDLAERCWQSCASRGVEQVVSIITNGLLLSRETVSRLLPFGLVGVKVTLDGDRETHDRMRPARGGQGTFDRIIANVGRVADLTPVAIGGNFSAETAGRYPALLDFLGRQDFAGRISKVAFKPVIRQGPAGCGSTASACDGCHVADDQISMLREETKRRGFPTADGLHMGPCELYRRHSHTIGPDGSLYACPGFTGDNAIAVGHIAGAPDPVRDAAAADFGHLAPWRQCGECPFIPVCGGGCAVASHAELGDMNAPSCHKRVFESALLSLAEETAGLTSGRIQCASQL